MVKRTNKSRYVNYNLKITDYQLQTIVKAVQNHEGAVIRVNGAAQAGTTQAGSALTPRKIPLTQAQINKIRKSKSAFNLKLSAAQLKYLEKSGGFLPLLALLPLIFGGIGAAGGLTGAIASVVSSASNARAAAAAQTELVRHNKKIEAQLKGGVALANGSGAALANGSGAALANGSGAALVNGSGAALVNGSGAALANGSGFISDKIENIPVLGRLAPYLRKLGLGICDCKKLANGERIVTKSGLEFNFGHGIFMGPRGGNGIFMGPARGGCCGAELAGRLSGAVQAGGKRPRRGNGIFLGRGR